MGKVLDVFDEALDGFVMAEWLVTGTVFCVGLGLFSLGMALTEQDMLIRAPLILGGIGAMLIAVRAVYEIRFQGVEVYNAPARKQIYRKKRPSPSLSATSVNVGTRKRGGDGKMYVCKSYKRGRKRVKRWVRV